MYVKNTKSSANAIIIVFVIFFGSLIFIGLTYLFYKISNPSTDKNPFEIVNINGREWNIYPLSTDEKPKVLAFIENGRSVCPSGFEQVFRDGSSLCERTPVVPPSKTSSEWVKAPSYTTALPVYLAKADGSCLDNYIKKVQNGTHVCEWDQLA